MVEKSRIIGLDYLRGAAACAVVLFHFGFKGPTENWMKGGDFGSFSSVAGYGYLGVNLFFLISGFVIAMSAQNANWQSFLRARFIRLMPAMWICATVTAIGVLLIGALATDPSIQTSFAKTALTKNTWSNYFASLTLVPSWFGFPGIDSAYWSLRIEVQFYLAVCLLLLFGKRPWARAIVITWLVASTLNLIRPIWRLDYVFCLTWAPYFVVGIVLNSWRSSGKSFFKLSGLAWSTALCVGYAYKSAVKDGYEIPILSCSLVIFLIGLFSWTVLRSENTSRSERTLLCKTGLWLGAISYPLYLLHQELGYALFNATVYKLNVSNAFALAIALMTTTLTICILTWVISRWPERSITKFLSKQFPLHRVKTKQ
jgi:peptidoglycan/LPS O-acetylase OafA/YrhL